MAIFPVTPPSGLWVLSGLKSGKSAHMSTNRRKGRWGAWVKFQRALHVIRVLAAGSTVLCHHVLPIDSSTYSRTFDRTIPPVALSPPALFNGEQGSCLREQVPRGSALSTTAPNANHAGLHARHPSDHC